MVRHDRKTGQQVTILVDSGATYNYIRSRSDIGKSILLPETCLIKTLHGYSVVRSKRIINLFGYDLTFFDIEELNEHDMILGGQGLKQIKATLDFAKYKIYYKDTKKHKINYTNNCPHYDNKISNLMKQNELISEKLPFQTTIEATIRTKTNEPIWTK